MKKYLTILLTVFAFTFFQNNIHAQINTEFAPDHAAWWHYHSAWFGPTGSFGLNHSSVKGDTLLQGVTAKIIQQDLFLQTINSNNSTTVDTSTARNLFVYDAGDTVFIFNENFNRFTPLFVFNVNEGDTVCLPVVPDLDGNADLRPNPIANGDTCFCFQIDSIRMVLYDTTYLKTFYQHALIDSNQFEAWPVYNWRHSLVGGQGGWQIIGAYAQKIAGLYGGFLPQRLQLGVGRPTQDTLIYSHGYAFKCYEDDSTAIHILDSHGTDCYFDITTNLTTIDPNIDFIQVYPNPNDGFLTLESSNPFSKSTRISISDLSGRTLKNYDAPVGKSKISLSLKDLSSGIYLLRFEADGRSLYKKVVVQQR